LNNFISSENVRRQVQRAAKARKAQSAWRIANETPWKTKEVIMDKPNFDFQKGNSLSPTKSFIKVRDPQTH
jgi:hypothetical protein